MSGSGGVQTPHLLIKNVQQEQKGDFVRTHFMKLFKMLQTVKNESEVA